MAAQNGKTAIVTGASRGIGADGARVNGQTLRANGGII
jgi:short-subunit dehydrogenase